MFIALARNKRLTAKAIFEIVRDFMESAKPRNASWDELLTRGGPNSLRNGCIKRMIEGHLPFELIFHVLGVKSKALERFLPHCSEAARSRYERELAEARAEAKQP